MAKSKRGTVAVVRAYGPDNTRATQLVVSIHRGALLDEPSVSCEWTVDEGDIRENASVAAELEDVLAGHHVRETIRSPGILGCPHEEGLDYPMGRECPHCPYWAGIDPVTLEPRRQPEPLLSPEQVLEALGDVEGPSPDADVFTSADAHREALVGPLLEAMETALADPRAASDAQAQRFCYALCLCAKWRETRAYPLVVRWLSLPGDDAEDLAGDMVTQDGGRILASVCDGTLEPILALAVDREANEYARCAAIVALSLLGAWAEVPGETIVEHLAWLAREGLPRTPDAVWETLAGQCVDIEAIPVFGDLRRAIDEGLIDARSMTPEALDEAEATPPGTFLADTRERWPPVRDVAELTWWWNDAAGPESASGPEGWAGPAEPHRAPARPGRNEPCPCGSGRKFKKCCGA
jgi:hypothetical protein